MILNPYNLRTIDYVNPVKSPHFTSAMHSELSTVLRKGCKLTSWLLHSGVLPPQLDQEGPEP